MSSEQLQDVEKAETCYWSSKSVSLLLSCPWVSFHFSEVVVIGASHGSKRMIHIDALVPFCNSGYKSLSVGPFQQLPSKKMLLGVCVTVALNCGRNGGVFRGTHSGDSGQHSISRAWWNHEVCTENPQVHGLQDCPASWEDDSLCTLCWKRG